MEEKQELNDIILNKNSSSNTKKLIFAIATLGVILVIVVLVMNSINSSDESNLPQAQNVTLPPKPEAKSNIKEEPLFEDVEIVDETNDDDEKLDDIAKKLKQQSQDEEEIVQEDIVTKVEEPIKQKKVEEKKHKKVLTTQKTPVKTGDFYIQVGSFSKFSPDKKFLNKIKANGYNYSFHKVVIKGKNVTKVVIGPYKSKSDAKRDLNKIRKSIIKGAFIVRLKK